MASMEGKNILIVGGAGFIGSHFVDRAVLENPANLIVIDTFFLGREENLSAAAKARPDLKILRVDASDLAALQEVVESEKVDVVFNFAVIPLPVSLSYPVWTLKTNIGIVGNLCELARRGSIETLVHCSSSEAYGTAQYVPMDETHPLLGHTPYAASKAASDQIVRSFRRTFNIDSVIVRPFNNFGPRQNAGSYAAVIPTFVQRIRNGDPIEIFGDGEQARDFVFVRDTAEAFLRAYQNEDTRGKELNVSTGKDISINSLATALLDVIGIPDYPVLHAPPRPGDVARLCGDGSLARELIGFEPKVLVEAHLKETIDWYMRSDSGPDPATGDQP